VTTVFGSATSLTATIPASLVATVGTASVRVVSPVSQACGQGGTSNTLTFTITGTPQIGTLETSSVEFLRQAGEGPVSVVIPVPVANAPAAFTASLQTISGGNWLTVSPAQGTSPASLTLTADPSAASSGVHKATVAVASGGRTQQIVVTFILTTREAEQPVYVAPATVEVSYRPNSGTVVQQIPVLGAVRPDEPLRPEAQVITPVGRSWLQVQQNTPGIVTARIDTNQLPSRGVYLARIVYRRTASAQNRGAGTPVAAVKAGQQEYESGTCLAAASEDKLSDLENVTISPASLSFGPADTGATLTDEGWRWPRKYAVTITSITEQTAFTAKFVPCEDISPWLELVQGSSPASSSEISGATNAEIGPRVMPGTLAARKYSGKLAIVDASGERGKVLDVDMVVGDAIEIGSGSGREEFTISEAQAAGAAGAANNSGGLELRLAEGQIVSRTVTVRSRSGNPVTVSPSVDAAEGDWLKLKDPGPVTTPADITLLIDTSRLVSGRSYSASVSARGAASTGTLAVLVNVTPSAVQVPVIDEITNAATLRSGSLAPGTLFSIKGRHLLEGLATETRCPAPAIRQCLSSGVPLRNNLAGLQVLIDGKSVPLLFAGRIVLEGGITYDQVNALAPSGLTGGRVQLQVKRQDVTSTSTEVAVAGAAPGIFTTQSSGTGQGIVTLGNTRSIAAPAGTLQDSRPAKRGEVVILWATGLGEVVSPSEPGYPIPGERFNPERQRVTNTPAVLIGGRPAELYWAGIAPDFVGLYQLIVFVPRDATPGDRVPVQIQIGDITTRDDVTIAVSDEAVAAP
jgi:uncharacterized protein (TIGR03437 family)